MSDKKPIRVSKETHKQLSIKKIKGEYRTFEDLLIAEVLEDEDDE